ncbi:MAG TPA: hemolysin family protein [Prolixibacteraceae bacterium]|nr:hemolysin family protein [Prolixibacteraceae bacterium]HPS12383.1 hemolysin family protein [Prolixibacteraceae bacterium]
MPLLITILITLAFLVFFTGMNVAYQSADRMSLEVNKQKGTFTSAIINIFASNTEQYIATMQIGSILSVVTYGITFVQLTQPLLLPYSTSPFILLFFQILISTITIYLAGEIIPQTLFRINSNSFLTFFAIPVLISYTLFYPLAFLLTTFQKKIIKNIDPENEKNVFSKVDLDHYVNQTDSSPNDENSDGNTEIELFKNALDFSKVKVRDCMVPRTEIEAIELNASIDELRTKFVETGYSKILVYDDSFDNLIGYVHSSQIFKNPTSIKTVIHPVIVVPETMLVSELLGTLTQKHKTIAIVVDEFGSTSGLITIEDILEEIFGEIEDEHDTDNLTTKKLKEGRWILSARHEISYLNDQFNFNLPENPEYDTIAGLILNQYESIPKTNSVIAIGHFEFRILKATKTRIELVLMKIVDMN